MITVLGFLGVLAIIYGIVGLILKKSQLQPQLPFGSIAIKLGVVAIFATYFFSNMVYRIDGQDVGVRITPQGVNQNPVQPGLHVKWPWVIIHQMDRTLWVYTMAQKTADGQHRDADEIWASTVDVIKIGIDVSAAWRIDDNYAPWIYSKVSGETNHDIGSSPTSPGKYDWLEENIIRPTIVSCVTNVVSKYTPQQVISSGVDGKRAQIEKEVYDAISTELAADHLILQAVNIRQVYYNTDYENSVIAIQTAEKEAERLLQVTVQKQELLKQADIDKQIVIKKAEGDAESIQLRGAAISANPKVISLEFIKALNTTIAPDGTTLLPGLKLPQTLVVSGGGSGMNAILNLPNSMIGDK